MVFRVGAISEKIAYDGSTWAIGGLLMYVFAKYRTKTEWLAIAAVWRY